MVLLLALAVALPAHAATVGQPAPAFTLSDQDGATVALESFAGKVVVLEWTNPDCPFVKRHYRTKTMTTLAERFGKEGVVWLAVSSTATLDPARLRTWRSEEGITYPILDDRAGTVGHAYGAKTTPHLFVIDPKGVLVYAGGIDDDPAGESGDKATNYVALALEDVTAGKPVRTPETKPYGCSVKYAN
ncbi:MAG: thioredoxin family protein [bacterium]|nr:thioredoxin family protein [bacterium]